MVPAIPLIMNTSEEAIKLAAKTVNRVRVRGFKNCKNKKHSRIDSYRDFRKHVRFCILFR